MATRRRSLYRRLFVSSLIVVLVGSAAFFVTARFLGPALFDTEVDQIGQRYGWRDIGSSGNGGSGGRGQGGAVIETELNDAFANTLTLALVAAAGSGIIAAAAGAAVGARRLVRLLGRMQTAVRRMADGEYEVRVEEPADAELADLARDVNSLAAALEASEERRTRLVSDLAHELRTPITSLQGYLEGLEDGVFEATPGTLRSMRDEAGRLQRLAADLSSLSRADEDAFDLQPSDLDLAGVVTAAGRSQAAQFAVAGVVLEIGSMPELPVSADPDRMTQVFTNLLRNALSHTGSGAAVRVSGARAGGTVTVTVADEGSGVDPEHLPHLFERFYRAEPSRRSGGGSGIGLTIARSITRAHGGEVVADSAGPGRGATFTVTLPMRS